MISDARGRHVYSTTFFANYQPGSDVFYMNVWNVWSQADSLICTESRAVDPTPENISTQRLLQQ